MRSNIATSPIRNSCFATIISHALQLYFLKIVPEKYNTVYDNNDTSNLPLSYLHVEYMVNAHIADAK